ncbi:MAG: MerR family transcriptional regulator [Candidatus Eremiobacteraeota bacterium]|nr:MerR family transcriptional regulator [Candidatus Eremiobacteraeota bacterium]
MGKSVSLEHAPEEGASWSLGELSQITQEELERRKIPNPGGRVSQVPSARTIRYYTSLGLVDRPLGYDGGVAQYGHRHLMQLLAIKVLQAEYLPLPEIHKHLHGRTIEELGEIVDSATRDEEIPREPAARVESWLTIAALPGLRLMVEDRQALLEWVRNHSDEEAVEKLNRALKALTNPGAKT